MTERGPSTGTRGAPDPAEPSTPGALADLGAVRRTDAIIESLAACRAAGSASRSGPGADTGRLRPADDPDPAVRLLRALIGDVDDPGSERDAGPEREVAAERGTGPEPTPP
ncbi:hypothetical protein E1281_34805, partial [Actinomadura sp. KC345]|uniref:hypothetical protein n=1 Tax=Actinomadura sp. KC345 TaxID=2530371 RepID=UPI0010DC546D